MSYIAWIGWSLLFVSIAMLCTKWISSDAEGSGIPEMKSILGGYDMVNFICK